MPYKAHRHGDQRICGATTVVSGQTTLYVNNKLWAVKYDMNSHGGGGLINSGTTLYINNKLVIVHRADNALPDNLCPTEGDPHCNPQTAQGSGDTFAY